MREVAVSTLLTNLKHMVGVDSLLTQEQDAAVRSFNRFGRLAWERARWPDTIRLEPKLPDVQVRSIDVTVGGSGYSSAPTVTITGGSGSGATAVATINADGQVNGIAVTANGGGYLSAPTITFSGGGGSGAEAKANLMGVLEFGSAPSTAIGEILRITEKDPYAHGSPTEVPYRVEYSASGYGKVVLVDRATTSPVFVLHRKPFIDYTSGSTDYPYIFSEYAVLGAYSDHLNSDGQMDKALAVQQQAEAVLLTELDKLERQQGQNNFIQFITYGSTIQTPY